MLRKTHGILALMLTLAVLGCTPVPQAPTNQEIPTPTPTNQEVPTPTNETSDPLPPPSGALNITAESTALQGTVGAPISLSFTGNGGNGPYTWMVIKGALPSGTAGDPPVIYCIRAPCPQTASPVYRVLGTPAQAGKYTFTLQMRDQRGRLFDQEFTITIAAK